MLRTIKTAQTSHLSNGRFWRRQHASESKRWGQILFVYRTVRIRHVCRDIWVAFWALYGQGLTAANLAAISTFGGAYLLVVLIEPLVDLLVLGSAKAIRGLKGSKWVTPRLHSAA